MYVEIRERRTDFVDEFITGEERCFPEARQVGCCFLDSVGALNVL